MQTFALSIAVGAIALLGASAVNAAPAPKQAVTPVAAHGKSIIRDTDMSAHRRHWRRHHHHWGHRHHHWGHHPRFYRSYGFYRPARVVRYYRPAPVFYGYHPYYYRPAPVFSIGFGFGPRIWW